MSFPFASWEFSQWRSEFLSHASVQLGEYLLQLAALEIEQSGSLSTWEKQLFFRVLGSEEEGDFVVAHPCASPFYNYRMGVREFGDLTVAELSTQLEEALIEGNFARVFFLNENEQLRRNEELALYTVIVGATGWAKWIVLDPNGLRFPRRSLRFQIGNSLPTTSAAFQWTDAPDVSHFLSTPALEVWATIQSQKQDVSSDCAFARCVLNTSDVDLLVLRWNEEKHLELHRVLKAAFLNQTKLWEATNAYQWIINLGKLKLPWHRGDLMPLQGHSNGRISDAPDCLRDILRRVSPYFDPPSVENYLAPHLEVARRQVHTQNPLRIRVENPTAHERLEAALFWREWQEAHPSHS